MNDVTITIIVLITTSPLTIPIFKFVKNKVTAKLILGGWRALFLTNGQVYFGKITSLNNRELTIKDIYYLQDDGVDSPEKLERMLGQNISLIKLGSELHNPKDKMIINTLHIIFYEKLEDKGGVVTAIKDYKHNK